MNKFGFLLSLWLAKLISLFISIFQLGQASNFPGKVALLVKSDLLQSFKFKTNTKIILVSGTNGKSTTCGLVASILKAGGFNVIYNKSGANLLSGVASTFCHYCDYLGNLICDFIVLEVDEASLTLFTKQIKPHYIGITNFFRDQLDRFGELDTTVKLIEKGINNNNDITVILNADDPRVAFLNTENRKVYYGLGKGDPAGRPYNETNDWLSDPEEVVTCPKCKKNLTFKNKFLAHLGDYLCPRCNTKRPETDFQVTNFKTDKLTINFDLTYKNQKHNFFLPIIGTFNLYNALCSIAISRTASNITPVQIQKGFQSYSTIFGRSEKVTIKNKTVWIYLIKNPTGTTEVLKTLNQIQNARFLIAINDNVADGRDISWLWDARFDILANHKKDIYISGKRALDMAIRLKYADLNSSQIKVNENISAAINIAIKSLKDNETLYLLPTYTALLEMQRKGFCKKQPL